MAGLDSYVKLLLHMDGTDGSTTFTDSSSGAKTVTAYGNAQIDTAQSKFGGASGLFDGNDYLLSSDSDDWNFGSGDFTIDCWVRLNSLPSVGKYFYTIAAQSSGSTDGWRFRFKYPSGAGIEFQVAMNSVVTARYSFPTRQWFHIAVVRNGTSFTIYYNGTSIGSGTSSDSIADMRQPLYVATSNFAGYTATALDGWIDEFRISKGIARWTEDFTPPTSAYSSDNTTGDAALTLGDLTLAAYGPNVAALTLPAFSLEADTSDAALTLSALSIEAYGPNEAALTLPAYTVDALGPNEANLTLSALVVEGVVGQNLIELTLEALTASGTGFAGTIADSALTLSAYSVEALGPNKAELTFPALVVDGLALNNGVSALTLAALSASATGLAGTAITGDCDLAAFECEAEEHNSGRWDGDLTLSQYDTEGALITGTVIEGGLSLSRLTVAVTGYAGNSATAELELGALDTESQGWPAMTYQGALALLPLVLDAYATQALSEAYRGIAINLKNRAVTEHEAFDFNSMCYFGEKHLAAHADGIYVLEGEKDETTDIDAEVRTGVVIDPGAPEKKRVPEAYLSIKMDGDFIFGTITDGNYHKEYTAQEDGKTSMHNGKVHLGRGILSNYWGATFRNSEGSDFELQSIELISKAGNRF